MSQSERLHRRLHRSGAGLPPEVSCPTTARVSTSRPGTPAVLAAKPAAPPAALPRLPGHQVGEAARTLPQRHRTPPSITSGCATKGQLKRRERPGRRLPPASPPRARKKRATAGASTYRRSWHAPPGRVAHPSWRGTLCRWDDRGRTTPARSFSQAVFRSTSNSTAGSSGTSAIGMPLSGMTRVESPSR